jgi:hypothetical protein
VPDSYFDFLGVVSGGSAYRADRSTGGPWDPGLQHGGPPGALLVHAAETTAAAETGRTDLIALRYAAEFVGPVPVAEVVVSAQVVRAARSAVLVEASLRSADRICLQARVWLVRDADTAGLTPPASAVADPPAGQDGLGSVFPYGESIEWRLLRGGLDQPGPGATWARPRLDLVTEYRMSGLQRAVLIGDSASGLSAELDWAQWSFLNVDLDVHLARPVHGDWLLLDARTQLGSHGSALAASTLSDLTGPVGVTAQTLVLAPRR